MSTYISLGANPDGTPNVDSDDDEAAPSVDVAVDCWGRNIRLWVDFDAGTTFMQPAEARRLATYLEYAATECEKRDHDTDDKAEST